MIAALFLIAATAKVEAFMPPKNFQRQDVEDYIGCIARFRKNEVRAVLAQRKHVGPRIFSALTWTDCYRVSWVREERSSIQLDDYYFAGKLAEFLIVSPEFSATPQDVARGISYGPPAFFDPNDDNDAIAEKIRVTMDCAVKADPKSARDAILNHGSTGQEALAILAGAASKCEGGELVGQMPADAQRTAAALSYYRLGMAAVEASGS